jgi:hypothetical protein
MITLEFLRSLKIGEYAIFDIAISFLGIWILSPILSKLFKLLKLDIPLSSWIYLALPIGILAHIVVGRYTPMTKYFLDPTSHYLLKLFILALVYLGLRRIKIIEE